LADSLAGEAQLLADFFERARLMAVEAESHPQDGGFTLVHCGEHVHHVVEAIAFHERIVRHELPLVHDHVAERPAGFGLIGLRRGVVDLDGFFNDGQLFLGQAQHAAHLFRCRGAAELFG
jgi:hypothetical protein